MGGAHRDHEAMMTTLKNVLKTQIAALQKKTTEALLETRYERLMSYGKFKETVKK